MEIGVVEKNPASDNETAPPIERSDAEVRREAAERLEEIHQYLRDRYARRDIVMQTETRAGQQLDWIPVESQSSDGKIDDPPDEDRPVVLVEGEYEAEPIRFELQEETATLGPPGTVPVVRKPIERIRPVGDLQDWLAKSGRLNRIAPPDDPRRAEPPALVSGHKYADAYQAVTCYGTEGDINIWKPYVEWSDEFSLCQLWLERGSGTQLQTVEVGSQVYRNLYGDWEPHLFIYYTTNGYAQSGDYLGGYNQDVDGWRQVSNSIYPETLAKPLSQLGGTQYTMTIKVQLSAGNWWVRVNGIWMGYYPASLYSPTGLRFQASLVDWGGEVFASPVHPGTTGTDMGSGRWPSEGWQRAAFINHLQYQSAPGGALTPIQGVGFVTNPLCYDLITNFGNTGSWGSHLWYGGPGRNPACP
jgi:hypothetical protein